MIDVRGLLAERAEHRALLTEEAERIAIQLRELGARKVVLFGSAARGEANVHSDLDFVVVMPGEQGFAYWSRRLYGEIDRRVAVDFLPYNEREFAEAQRHSRLVRHALRTGKVLYEKPS
ncbi:MAG: nucleotidyltransferase family protein [Anaerolineae bacterium]